MLLFDDRSAAVGPCQHHRNNGNDAQPENSHQASETRVATREGRRFVKDGVRFRPSNLLSPSILILRSAPPLMFLCVCA